uniref:Uncharacterized protein n=1 Tax=Anguilla anguilla TaxID=7936 RepID=A0A0E9P759_ANGAN
MYWADIVGIMNALKI